MDERTKPEPRQIEQERQELASIDYLLARLESMQARELIAPSAYATVAAEALARRDEIQRAGQFRAAMAEAARLAVNNVGEALAWAERARSIDPGKEEAWSFSVNLLVRVQRLNDARALCLQAAERFPTLLQRLDAIPSKTSSVEVPHETHAATPAGAASAPASWSGLAATSPPASPALAAALPPPPTLAWASIAGAFIEEHWQKLILSLAVLLIIVSSTVGAHMVLGPKLWSPSGKCTLAVIYTVMFAGFGAGLTRWGAERAGRMMLVTTLVVVPVNFMLAGEMRLLTAPTWSRLLVLAVDVAALLAVSYRVAISLGWRRGAMFLALALVALSGCDAATAHGVPLNWGLAAFLAPPWIFLGAVGWLNARYREDDVQRSQPEFVDLALGVLAFAFLSGELRTAVVLHLTPPLFAVPVMITAIACVQSAHVMARVGEDLRRVMSVRFVGLVLSALAFALALARPPGPSALYSANTLATAILGLALYAGALRAYRQPPYLYFAFGALFVGYFGAFYFVHGIRHAIEEAVRLALGYRQKLPLPFKALNGLVFNSALGLLALWFSGRWKDERLARHCHYLGVPFSIAACVFSGFETKAAVICLAGYAVLYMVGVVLFRQPRLLYLACAALSGSLVFGSMLVPGATLAEQALGGPVLGFAFLAAGAFLASRRVDPAYRTPLIHTALALALGGMAAASVSATIIAPAGVAAALAFALSALLCGVLAADFPRAVLAHATTAGVLGTLFCIVAMAGRPLSSPVPFGVAAAVLAAAWPVAVVVASRQPSRRAAVFASAVPDAVRGLVVLAMMLAVGGLGTRAPAVAASLALSASGMLGATRFRRATDLVNHGLALAVAAALVLGSWWSGWADPGVGVAGLALSASLAAALLGAAGVAIRRAGDDELYSGPCLKGAELLTAVIFALAVAGRLASRSAFPVAAGALVGDALVCIGLAAIHRAPRWTYASVGSVVAATYLALLSAPHPDPEKAYIMGLVAVAEALVLWTLGLLVHRSKRGDVGRVYARPLLVWSLVLTVLAVPFGLDSPVTMTLVAGAFVLTIKSFPATGWIYPALGALAWALGEGVLQGLSPEVWMGAALGGAFGLWGAGIVVDRFGPALCRRLGLVELAYDYPFFNSAIAAAAWALVLRFDLTLTHGVPWTSASWIPVGLALFCLLMLKPYPRRVWVHGFAGLATAGLAMAAGPWIASTEGWLLAAVALALAWLALGRDLFQVEPALVERFGLDEVGGAAVLETWSAYLATVAAASATVLVTVAALSAVFDGSVPHAFAATAGSWRLGATLLLACVYVAAESGRLGEDRWAGLYWLALMLLWWMGLSDFAVRVGIHPRQFLPLATAGLALAIEWLGPRGTIGVSVSARRVAIAGRFALWFAVTAAVMTRLDPTFGSAAALLVSALVLGRQAVVSDRLESAYLGSVAWSLACVCLALRLADGSPSRGPLFTAIALAAASLALWAVTGPLRRASFGLLVQYPVILAIERVMLTASFASVAAAGLAALDPPAGDVAKLAGVGVVVGAGALHTLLAGRWRSEALVYVAQATLLAAYVDYRLGFPLPVATDAAVLTFLGFLDLGIAEVMARLRLNLYARPTLYVSLVLPLIPVARAVAVGRLDDLSLFLLFSTATFYGVACYAKQWKSLGYAAAVVLNAALWIAWSRAGWRLADHPQFFLVPVGFSAILFAEVNRRELGNDGVNTIRVIGLLVVYSSLALPVWQFQTLGAWLAMLLISLLGVFAGIGLRIQSFLWLGLIGFVLDVVYQLGRMGAENALARWAIMLAIGVALIVFVALNEKKRVVGTMRQLYEQARQWE